MGKSGCGSGRDGRRGPGGVQSPRMTFWTTILQRVKINVKVHGATVDRKTLTKLTSRYLGPLKSTSSRDSGRTKVISKLERKKWLFCK